MDSAVLRTERLDHDVDLVALGARSGLLWVRERAGLAGAGRLATLPLRTDSEDSRDSVRSRLAALAGDDRVVRPGSGAAGFAALPFDPDAEGEVVVAEVTVGRSDDGVRFITFPEDRSVDEAWDLVRSTLARPLREPQPSRYELRTPMSAGTWCDRLEAVRCRIAAGELEKVVLAREALVETDEPMDPARVVSQLAGTFPSAILFLVDGFCGASPELLVSRRGDLVRSHPLAGTAARSSDPAVDARLAARLLASDKDRWEHQITIDAALDLLLPFCSYVDAEPEPAVVRLANVQHLGTLVEGRLSGPPASVLELVAALHPTPAVGGAPRDDALKVIADVEGVDRGRYAGPTGWFDANGNGSFAVSVRSAQLAGTAVRLFAGVGVVADSDPASELEETRAKFAALLGAMIRP